MDKCKVLLFETPDGYRLNGLWYGPDKPKKAFIYLHGLTSSVFSGHENILPLVDDETAALFFNNRGNGIISKIHKKDDSKKGYTSEIIGAGKEIFTECVDDIQGAIDLMKDSGAEDIYLVGHSTGCQKSVYFLSDEKRAKQVAGVVLLCPLSDYAAALVETDQQTLKKATEHAWELVSSGRPRELMDNQIWPEIIEAQRFISLYTPDSEEEIFSYATERKPSTLKKVSTPTLAVFAGEDEYADRPAREIEQWFKENNESSGYDSLVVDGALHNLMDRGHEVAGKIKEWLA